MVNIKRGRFTPAFWRSLGVFLLSVPLGTNAVQISNGVPDGTVGSFRVDVETGGATRNVVVTAARLLSRDIVTTNVVRNYYGFFDPGNDGLGDRLSGSPRFQTPSTRTPSRATGFSSGSTASIGRRSALLRPEHRS